MGNAMKFIEEKIRQEELKKQEAIKAAQRDKRAKARRKKERK